MTRQELTREALKLPPDEREAFAQELLLSIDDAASDAIDAAWLQEAHHRSAAYAAGKMPAKAVDEMIKCTRARNLVSGP
jgi:putative addiction module component (TIGR02574 family)